MRKSTSILYLLFILIAPASHAQETIRFNHLNYDELIAKAKQEKKPVMIFLQAQVAIYV